VDVKGGVFIFRTFRGMGGFANELVERETCGDLETRRESLTGNMRDVTYDLVYEVHYDSLMV